MNLLKAITQSILGQIQHPGTVSESTDQGLSFGIKIDRITCFFVGDMSDLSFGPVYTSPTVGGISGTPQLGIVLEDHQGSFDEGSGVK